MNHHVKTWGQRIVGVAALAAMTAGITGCQSMNSNVRLLEPRVMKDGMVPAPYKTPTGQKGMAISPFAAKKPVSLPPVIGPGPRQLPPQFKNPKPPRTVVRKKLPKKVKTTHLTYTVKKGDYLSKIAVMHKVSTRELASFNNMKIKDVLPVGKVLRIPPGGVKPSKSTVAKAVGGAPKWHVVQKGEILGRIANKHKVSVAELVKWNKLSSANTIFKGQKLAVNEAASRGVKRSSKSSSRSTTLKKAIPASGIHKVKKNESWWSIAHQYHGLDSIKLRDINAPKRTLHPNDIIYLTYDAAGKNAGAAINVIKGKRNTVARAKLPANKMYTVKPGDTLSDIAKKFGVRLKKLRQDNGLKTDLLMPGQTLMVYGEDASAGTIKPGHKKDPSKTATKSAGPTTIVVAKADDDIKNKTILPHFVDPTSDTLKEIAEMYGSKVAWILKANPNIKSDSDLKKVKEIQVPVEDLNLGNK